MEQNEPLYFITYTGSDIVTLGKEGTFQNGTSAYVGEKVANQARSHGDFTVSGPIQRGGPAATGGAKKEEAKAAPAPAKAEEKPAEKPAEKKAEEKPAEKKADEKPPEKAEEKKADEKKPEKPAEAPKPANA